MQDKEGFKPLWELYPEIWATKSKFFTWLRGQLRRALWEKYPPKLQFKNQQCSSPPEGLETRAKTGTHCALTGEWIGKSKLEVDHVIGEASLRDWEDFIPFCMHLLTTTDNMQLVGKDAHKVKSYAERMGITFDQAMLEKKIISFKKLNKNEQIYTLTIGHNCEIIPSTIKGRVDLYRSLLEKGIE